MDEPGFEYKGIFYPWHITTTGKDLLLIDRIAKVPPQEFFELVEDGFDMGRSSITFALMATSMRNRFPDRSLERIQRTVEELNLDDVTFVGGPEEGEPDPDPLAAPGVEAGPSESPGTPSSESPELTTSETSPENPPG